jgi:polar amino acid transport system substrate-binding protein
MKERRIYPAAWAVLVWLIALPALADQNVLRYAIFPAPPFMIGAADERAPVSGIDVEIVGEIARRMDCRVQYIRAPWVRCLNLMETGRADLLSSAFMTPERQAYMVYLSDPFLRNLPIAFYFKTGSGFSVDRYEDLYQYKSIGVLKGASYFERFDHDEKVAKVAVTSQDQLFPMLTAGRLEVIAGYVDTENYRLAQEGYRGKVERSVFEVKNPVEVYMAVSRKSPWLDRLPELDQINRDLLKEGFIQRVIDKYEKRYR